MSCGRYCGFCNTLKASRFWFRALRKLVPNLPTIHTSVSYAALVVFLLTQLGLSFNPRLNGLYVKATLSLEFVPMPVYLVKPLEVEAPSLELDTFFKSKKPLLPFLLKLPLLPLVFLKLGVNVVAPFPVLSPLLSC